MKLFYVTNGWQADLPMSVLAVAEDEDRAIVLARPLFIRAFEMRKSFQEKTARLKDLISFHTLECTELCPDTAVEWVCEEMGEGLYHR